MINNNNLYDVEKLTGQPVVVIDGTAFPVSVAGSSASGSSMDFYKCASVDASAKTWSGYKAVLTDGVYSFAETVTEGLSYTENFPLPAQAYTSDLSVTVKELQSKDISKISGGEVVGERYVVAEAKTLATGYFTYKKLNGGWSLMWHVVTHGSDRDYYHIIAVGLDASAVRMDASGYNYEPVSFTVDGDSRTWYYCKSQGVGANDGFTPIFDGNPIDVGSNGEDYLSQAKELLNNYLAGTIIGQSPDTGGTPVFKVSGDDTNPEVNGDYYEVTPDNVNSCWDTSKKIYSNGTIYFAFTSNWWNGWTVVRDISITPFDDQGVTTSLAYSMGGHPNPWDVTDYNGDYFEIAKY